MPVEKLTEKELLLKVAHGNEQAFHGLFMRYHQLLGTHIYRITGSVELAEEIVQDVFLKIWINRSVLQNVQSFKNYLFVISKNQALNELRKLIKERQLIVTYAGDLPIEIADTSVDSNIYQVLLDKAIDQLPAQQQKVYLLSRHQRLKYAEISDRLGISKETVKKYLQLATTSINSYLRERQEVIVLLAILLKNF